MHRRTLLIAIGAALLGAPGLARAQAQTPLTIDEIELLLKNDVPQSAVGSRARSKCIDFEVDDATAQRLRRAGAGDALVESLREARGACRPARVDTLVSGGAIAVTKDMPAAAPVPTVQVRAYVLGDDKITVRPIPMLPVSFVNAGGDTVTRVATSSEGTTQPATLAPGAYTVVAMRETPTRRYRWAYKADVAAAAAPTVIELNDNNATVETVGPVRTRLSPAAAYERYRKGLFLVSGRESRSSAFLADTAGLVITSARTLRDSADLRVLIDDATRVPAKLLAADTVNDIAVLAIARSRCAACPALPLSDTTPRVMDQIVAMASPLARGTLSDMSLVSRADDKGTVSSIRVGPEMAGGPVLNEYGEVIGVASLQAGSRTDPSTSWSPSLVAVKLLLDQGRRALRAGAVASADLLPVAPRDSFPARAVEEFAGTLEPDLKLYLGDRNGVQLFIMTPKVVGWRQSQALLKARELKAKGETASETDKVDPIQLWREWDEYVASRRPAVVIAAAPKYAKFPFYDLKKNVKAEDGDVVDVQLMRDGQPVVPVEHDRFGATIRAEGARLKGDPAARQVVNVYNVDAFAPREDGAPSQLSVVVNNAAKGEAVVFELDRRTVEQILRDFQVYLLSRRR